LFWQVAGTSLLGGNRDSAVSDGILLVVAGDNYNRRPSITSLSLSQMTNLVRKRHLIE